LLQYSSASRGGMNNAQVISMESGEMLHLATCSIRMRFDPKGMDHAVRLLLSVRENIRAKRDCHACEVGLEAREEGFVHYREEWKSGEAFINHVQSAEFRRVLFALDLCCEEPRIVVGNLSGRTGISNLLKLRENT
jgi:quinol monooxygenase YgiN